MNMNNQVAIVTGSTKGIGKAIAIKLAKRGIKVIVCGRSSEEGEAVASAICSSGGSAQYMYLDLSSTDSLAAFTHQFKKQHNRLHILVNNAGVSGYMGPVVSTPVDAIRQTFSVNVESIFTLCQELIPMMQQQKYGRIVNISSVAYRLTPANSCTYNMSKAALNAFTQTLAKEVGASGITVNAIAPGLVLTDRIQNERLPGMASKSGVTPNQMLEQLTKGTVTSRLTTEDDIAEATLFLASEGAAAITGQILDVSSGV